MPLAGYTLHEPGDRTALAGLLANDIARLLSAAIAWRGVGFLAVSGGTTPAAFFAALAGQPLAWDRVIVTLVDERLVPETSERSNGRLVREKLLTGAAAGARFVPLYCGTDNTDEAVRLAGKALAGLPFPLDAAVLGMGPDGHTASFFPDASNLAALTDPAALTPIAAVQAQSAGEPRLTLTMRPLCEAHFLALHIEGAEKRTVLERALADDAPEKLPIRAVLEARTVDVYWAE